MSRYLHASGRRRHPVRQLTVGLVVLSATLVTAAGAYAGFAAKATGAETVHTGALDLTLTRDTGAGFSAFAGKMAPGDTDNVFVTLNNTGSLASAAGMTLRVAGSPVNALTDGSVPGEGLTVTVTQCSVTWTLASGSCAGTSTPILATTPISAMRTAATAATLTNVPALAATTGKVAHLRVSLGLVGTETSRNGVAPASSVQNLSTTLTYAFTEVQRAGVATDR